MVVVSTTLFVFLTTEKYLGVNNCAVDVRLNDNIESATINDLNIRVFSEYIRLELFYLSFRGERCMPKKEKVNHPSHYNEHPSGVECIDIIRHMNFNCGNIVKYLWRNGLKDSEPALDDLRKARFYLEDEIMRIEAEIDANATEGGK